MRDRSTYFLQIVSYNVSLVNCATTGAGGSTEETLFRCHKFILAARSDFFKGCFSHNFKETVTSVVDLPDAPVSAVETLLKFIYTDEVSQDEVDVDL